MKTISIRGEEIPQLGLGTWQLTGDDCTRAVREALEMGYRHVDTAVAYGNEELVGQALAQSGVSDEVFLTTKVWREDLGAADVVTSVESSLVKLKRDHIDNVLLHWPNPDFPIEASLDALRSCKERGLIRHYGVSNYPLDLFRKALIHDRNVWNNQVEHHVYLEQCSLQQECLGNDAFLTAYSPLARGRVTEDEVLTEIGAAHDATAAQVAIAWLLQRDVTTVIPKASSVEHLRSNWAAQQIELTSDEVQRIDALRKDRRLIDPGFAPTWDASAPHL